MSPTPPALSQVVSSLLFAKARELTCGQTPFPDLEDLADFRRDTLETSVVEACDNFLEFEGAVFELLNHNDNNNLWNSESAQDSSETHWTSTAPKHRSTSSLIPSNTMAENIGPRKETSRLAVYQNGGPSEDRADAEPRTPKRRMTPIYDDYQTAVSMIRSGTPKLPTTPPGPDKYPSKHAGEMIDLPKTSNRRYSSSMTDVHRKLAESHNDLHSAIPIEGHTLKQSATTSLPPEQERRVSIPVFPLRRRDSDDENERLIARGEYPPGENEENPAGIELEHHDIPLRDMELAQVRARTRGDPVSSQEMHASSADFDYADNSNIDSHKLATTGSPRASGSAPTETSTIGNIVDQYRTVPDGEMDNTYGFTDAALLLKQSSAGFGVRKDDAKPVYLPQPPSRAAADVGPAPSWPLPAPPPALPPRSSKRRNSSGMLSSPGGYGTTSGLLNTKLSDIGNPKITSSGTLSLSQGTRKKSSKSSSDLMLGMEADVGETDGDDGKRPDVSRLSHVSEKSSGSSRSSDDSEWMNVVGHPGRASRKEGGSGLVNGAGNVTAAHTLHKVEPAEEWSPGHRKAENVSYPSGLSTRRVRRRRGMNLGAGNKFGSLNQILAGQVDSDDETLDIVDTSDWETIHDSRSQNNLQYDDAAKEDMPVIGSDKMHSFGSLSLKEAPVSTWDPLSNKTPGFNRSENELGALLKTHKESTQNEQVENVGRADTNNASVPNLSAKAEESFSLPGSVSPEPAQPLVPLDQIIHTTQVNKPKPATEARYRHPTPLQPEHEHPFTGKRPVLPALPKTQSTSSSDTMAETYNHPNRNIESTSSIAADSGVSASATSREEHNRRVRDERNRRILAEIDLYDPGMSTMYKVMSTVILTLLQTVSVPVASFQMPASPSTAVFADQIWTPYSLKPSATWADSGGGSAFALLSTLLAAFSCFGTSLEVVGT